MGTDEYLIGLDIGGTKCAVVLGQLSADNEVNILDRSAFPTDADRGPAPTMLELISTTRAMLDNHRIVHQQVRAIGISCGGPLDSAKGLILSPPNLPGWDRVPIVARIQTELGIPTFLQNDANAGALAEWRFGAGRGTRNMVFGTFGTGFGTGLILNGQLYSGTNDMAGELGHVRLASDGPVGYGKRGSVEGFCSGGGIAQLARQAVLEQWQRGRRVSFCPTPDELDQLTARTVGKAAQNGDPLAKSIYSEVGRRLGQTLAILVDILNPELIVLGSIFTRQYELIWSETCRVLEEETLQQANAVCRVVPAALGEQIGDYAALAVALNQ